MWHALLIGIGRNSLALFKHLLLVHQRQLSWLVPLVLFRAFVLLGPVQFNEEFRLASQEHAVMVGYYSTL